ncbi:MAG: hypothetical protein ACYDG2_20195 [Ruminiclostridium sp.]
MGRNSESILQKASAKLIRNLRNRNYVATPANTSGKENSWDIEKIWVTRNGKDLCDINCENNTISYRNVYDRSEVDTILTLINNLQEQEENYLNAPQMKTKGFEKYKLLAEYNNVIFAACEVTSLDLTMHKVQSLNYVTWEKDRDASDNGVCTGHYFDDHYEAAKEDFAARSGLVRKDKIFSETEMVAVYAGLVKLDSIDESIKNKISNLIPDIEDKIYEKKPQFHENEKYEEESDDLEQEI